MAQLVREYVWEVPVRVTHWVNFLSILILSITGFYISAPRTLALAPADYVMGWARFIHFVAGYVFTVSVLSRVYWGFVGNKYSNWRIFFPYLTRQGRKNMLGTLRFYLFLSREPPHVLGHNDLAGATYLLVFLLFFVQIFTGFAIYSQYDPFSVMHNLFGWMYFISSNQSLRLVHNLVMWLLIAFTIHHVYSAWLMEIEEKGGTMSSIFGGYKSVTKRD